MRARGPDLAFWAPPSARAARARGMGANILTSGLGDTSQAPVTAKTLLGQ